MKPLHVPMGGLQTRIALFTGGGNVGCEGFYRLVEVAREATDEEIKKAYRKLVMAYHPDRNRGDPDREERLKEINEAYQVLGDEEKRRQYDLLCRQSFRNQVFYEGDLTDELIIILGEFSRGGFPMRGPGAAKAAVSESEAAGGGPGIFEKIIKQVIT